MTIHRRHRTSPAAAPVTDSHFWGHATLRLARCEGTWHRSLGIAVTGQMERRAQSTYSSFPTCETPGRGSTRRPL